MVCVLLLGLVCGEVQASGTWRYVTNDAKQRRQGICGAGVLLPLPLHVQKPPTRGAVHALLFIPPSCRFKAAKAHVPTR